MNIILGLKVVYEAESQLALFIGIVGEELDLVEVLGSSGDLLSEEYLYFPAIISHPFVSINFGQGQ